MIKEFKEFAVKGNVVDMAVGLVIGAAFGKIVTSFVGDILMPPVGLALGKVDFSNMYVSLTGEHLPTLKAAKDAGIVTLNYGLFLNTVLDFTIVAFAMFLVITQVNRMRRAIQPPPPPPPPATKECPYCISAIPVKATKCAHCTSAV